MCGRFVVDIPASELAKIFKIVETETRLMARYNVAPTQQIGVIRSDSNGTRHLDLLKWGLIPSWSKDPHIGYKMINARSETADTKPSFKSALKHRRCIIPASGFYEWREESGKKHPIYIKLKDNNLMLFAGIWDHWKAPEGNVIESCTMLTTETNDLIKPLHDRMPVILDTQNIDMWLDPQVSDPEQLKPLFRSFPSELMEMYQVSDLVNSPKNDNPSCIAPLA
jgi:putative SOS response-associated peptidase YedK